MVALEQVTARCGEVDHLFGGLDALGDDGQAEVVRDADDHLDEDAPELRAAREVVGEVAGCGASSSR
jgi:hypothetical protein